MNNDEELSTSIGVEYANNIRSTYKIYGKGILLFILFLVVILFILVFFRLKKYKI